MKKTAAIVAVVMIGLCALSCTSVTMYAGKGIEYKRGEYKEKGIKRVTFKEGVTFIPAKMFYGNKLTSLTIPKCVIGDLAFASNELTSLTIPEGVTIGKRAFAYNQLTSLVIPKGVTIGKGAFADNPLTSITVEGPVDCGAVDSFGGGGIVGFALRNGYYPGTYTKEGDAWRFNGAPLDPPKATLVMDYEKGWNWRWSIEVLKIDGADPSKFYIGFYPGERETYYVSPGIHTVEVTYNAGVSRKVPGGNLIERHTTKSEGSVTFDRYFFEGATYLFTGAPEGDQIRFRIVEQ